MQLHLQIESLTAGQKLLAANPPSALIPAAGTESPRLKVTCWEENSSSLCPTPWPVELSSSEVMGGREEVLWAAPAPGWDHCFTSSFWKLRGSRGMCRSTLLTSPTHSVRYHQWLLCWESMAGKGLMQEGLLLSPPCLQTEMSSSNPLTCSRALALRAPRHTGGSTWLFLLQAHAGHSLL